MTLPTEAKLPPVFPHRIVARRGAAGKRLVPPKLWSHQLTRDRYSSIRRRSRRKAAPAQLPNPPARPPASPQVVPHHPVGAGQTQQGNRPKPASRRLKHPDCAMRIGQPPDLRCMCKSQEKDNHSQPARPDYQLHHLRAGYPTALSHHDFSSAVIGLENSSSLVSPSRWVNTSDGAPWTFPSAQFALCGMRLPGGLVDRRGLGHG